MGGLRVYVDDAGGGRGGLARRDVPEKSDKRRRRVRAPSGFVRSTAAASNGLEREIGGVQRRAREEKTERVRGVGVRVRVSRETLVRAGRHAVRAAGIDAGEVRFAATRRHHSREPTKRDARDGEVRELANGEIASRGGVDEEIDGEERRENRRGDADGGEPEMRGGVTPKRVVAREVRKRTVHVHVVTRERGRRGGDDGHEQRFGDEIEQRAGDEREETRESRREPGRESNRRENATRDVLVVRRALAIRRGEGVRGDVSSRGDARRGREVFRAPARVTPRGGGRRRRAPTFRGAVLLDGLHRNVSRRAPRPRRAPPRGSNHALRQRRRLAALGSRELRRDERGGDERRRAVRGDVIIRRVELPREGSTDGRDGFAQPRRGVTPEREGRERHTLEDDGDDLPDAPRVDARGDERRALFDGAGGENHRGGERATRGSRRAARRRRRRGFGSRRERFRRRRERRDGTRTVAECLRVGSCFFGVHVRLDGEPERVSVRAQFPAVAKAIELDSRLARLPSTQTRRDLFHRRGVVRVQRRGSKHVKREQEHRDGGERGARGERRRRGSSRGFAPIRPRRRHRQSRGGHQTPVRHRHLQLVLTGNVRHETRERPGVIREQKSDARVSGAEGNAVDERGRAGIVGRAPGSPQHVHLVAVRVVRRRRHLLSRQAETDVSRPHGDLRRGRGVAHERRLETNRRRVADVADVESEPVRAHHVGFETRQEMSRVGDVRRGTILGRNGVQVREPVGVAARHVRGLVSRAEQASPSVGSLRRRRQRPLVQQTVVGAIRHVPIRRRVPYRPLVKRG